MEKPSLQVSDDPGRRSINDFVRRSDFGGHLPPGVSTKPTSWLSWPFRLSVRICAGELRSLVGFLRRLDDPHSRRLQYFVIPRRPDAIIPPA